LQGEHIVDYPNTKNNLCVLPTQEDTVVLKVSFQFRENKIGVLCQAFIFVFRQEEAKKK